MIVGERVLHVAHPRSGSTNLCEVLQQHPNIHLCEEPFNENYARWAPGNKNYRDRVRDHSSLQTVLAEIFQDHNGIKLLSYQLEEEWVCNLIRSAEFRVIFQRRRNLLQAVVSTLIAEQTTVWHPRDFKAPLASYYADLRPLEVAEVQERVQQLKDHLQRLEAVVDARSDGRVLKLLYEDVFFAEHEVQRATINNVWRFLDEHPVWSDRIDELLRPERSKMNSAATYRMVPNADEIDAQCGSDDTGWLFDVSSNAV